MTDKPDIWKCYRCRVGYHIAPCPNSATKSRCDACDAPFWHKGGLVVKMGMERPPKQEK